MKWLWIGAAIIFAVAAAATWFAFSRPDFMVGFIAAAVASIWQAIGPSILKTYRFEKQWRESGKHGEEWDYRTGKPKDPR